MSILSISTVSVHTHFRWISNMNSSNVAISSVQHSISVGLIERQYYQYPLYLKTDITVQTAIWTVVTRPSLKYSILFQWVVLIVNIVNIHCICTVISVESPIWTVVTSVGLTDRQYCQYPLYLNPDISVETPVWTEATWTYIQYTILINRALLNDNIVNICCISTLTFPLKL
jgi:hypothetical protein